MEHLFKGYIPTEGKKAAVAAIIPEHFKTYRQIRTNYDSYAGVLNDDVVLVDVDNKKEAEILRGILTERGNIGPHYHTARGMHFYFKNAVNPTSINHLKNNVTNYLTALGIASDFKIGEKTSYAVLKLTGEKRHFINPNNELQEFPAFLLPIRKLSKSELDARKTVQYEGILTGLSEGDGRNSALFSYILTLQNAGMDVDSIKETINIINKYVLKEPLEQREIDTILRDDAFVQNVFMIKGNFKFSEFGKFFRREKHIIKLKKNLYIYKDGIYVRDMEAIEKAMHTIKDDLTINQKREVVGYLKATIDEDSTLMRQSMIPFNNGLYDLETGKLESFAPEHITINKIPWDYKPDAYYELTVNTLNKLAGGNKEIRLLLEEMIGYCFYRKTTFGKAFMLLGDKGNGKSTLLETIKDLVGKDNFKSLDLKDLSSRFKSAELTDRLANIGDDIGDEFISDLSIFKKLVTGESINAERKGQDPFEFSNYAKLIFSANNLPRINDKTGAVLRRLVIIPFTSEFRQEDADYNPNIKDDLKSVESMEYLARLGIEGLERLLKQKGFTDNELSKTELEEYNIFNNPILDFFTGIDIEIYYDNPTEEFYKKYKEYCVSSNCLPESKISFCRKACKHFKLNTKSIRMDGRIIKIFSVQ